MTTNDEYLKEYVETRGLSPSTYRTMKYALNHYCKYNARTLDELILEADAEEEQRIRWKHTQLKKRLTGYMNYCKSTVNINTAKAYLNKVKGFYTHHDITIGKLPAWNIKNATISDPIRPDDLPTPEIIRRAVELADPLMRGLILFLVSTGMSKIDAMSLRADDFVKATSQNHHADNIQDAVRELMETDEEIIPVFELRRRKNNKYFITFCTSEAVREICNYLVIRDKRNRKYKRPLIQGNDKLFKLAGNTFTDKFRDLNNALGLGKAGTYNRLRGHNLRKFHASRLEKFGMSREYVRTLQGKSNGAVDDVYFYVDVDTLRREYVQAMEGVLILTEVKTITMQSEEYQLLLRENEELKKQNARVKSIEKEIMEIKKWYKF